eukprot:3329109-Pyramimonas_sp.AAC.1
MCTRVPLLHGIVAARTTKIADIDARAQFMNILRGSIRTNASRHWRSRVPRPSCGTFRLFFASISTFWRNVIQDRVSNMASRRPDGNLRTTPRGPHDFYMILTRLLDSLRATPRWPKLSNP